MQKPKCYVCKCTCGVVVISGLALQVTHDSKKYVSVDLCSYGCKRRLMDDNIEKARSCND